MGAALGAALPLNGIAALASGGGSGGLDVVLTDGIGVTYELLDVHGHSVTLTDGIGTASTLVPFYGAVLVERLAMSLTLVSNGSYQATLTDLMRLASSLYSATPVALSDGIGVNLAQQAQLAVQVIEGLGLAPVLAANALYGQTFTEQLRFVSTLSQFFGAGVIDGIGIAPVLAVQANRSATLTDGIGIAPVMTPQLVVRVTVTEAIDIDHIDALGALITGTLTDGIQFAAAYVSPGGGGTTDTGFTTWAMNTRNGAVTEYSNFAFNSFARMGDRYLGASSTGLYELIGDDDAGTDIIAQLKSGFAQWASTKLTGFKGVYLGVRGGGDYVLKLETGDDKTYVYAVNAKDMATTKVTLGKGLRARYFRFELISAGQDFDLDTIEFVPLVSERRV